MPVRYMSILNTCAQSTFSSVGSKNALGFSAYTGPKIVIGLRPWYKFDKRSDLTAPLSATAVYQPSELPHIPTGTHAGAAAGDAAAGDAAAGAAAAAKRAA